MGEPQVRERELLGREEGSVAATRGPIRYLAGALATALRAWSADRSAARERVRRVRERRARQQRALERRLRAEAEVAAARQASDRMAVADRRAADRIAEAKQRTADQVAEAKQRAADQVAEAKQRAADRIAGLEGALEKLGEQDAERIAGLEGALEKLSEQDAERIAGLERRLSAVLEEKAGIERIADALTAEETQAADAPELATALRRRHPSDRVDIERRGATTVEVEQEIRSDDRSLGLVLYHVRDEAEWRPSIVRAAKRSAARRHAALVVVVSRALPSKARRVGVSQGVMVVQPALAGAIAEAVRGAVVEAERALEAQRRRAEAERRRAEVSRRIAALREAVRRGLAAVRDAVRRGVARVFQPPLAALAAARRSTARLAAARPRLPAIGAVPMRSLRSRGGLRIPSRGRAAEVDPLLAARLGLLPEEAAPATPPATEPVAPLPPVPEEVALELPEEPMARALVLEAHCRTRIARADPGSAATVRDAASAFLDLGWYAAAVDLLLERVASGVKDREAQILLLDVARGTGPRWVADEKEALLAKVLRLDGREREAAEVEARGR